MAEVQIPRFARDDKSPSHRMKKTSAAGCLLLAILIACSEPEPACQPSKTRVMACRFR